MASPGLSTLHRRGHYMQNNTPKPKTQKHASRRIRYNSRPKREWVDHTSSRALKMEDSPSPTPAKRKDLEEQLVIEDGSTPHKRLKRLLTQESDLKVCEFAFTASRPMSCSWFVGRQPESLMANGPLDRVSQGLARACALGSS